MKYTDVNFDLANLDLDADMEINESALDVECLRQPKLAFIYGSNLSECKRINSEKYEAVKTIKAELVEKVNSDPDKYLGVGKKPTLQVVEAFYRNHKKFKKAKKEMIQATFEENIAFYAYQEISLTRKKMLENLIQLHNANYFAGPSIPRNLTAEKLKTQEQKQLDSNVASKLQRKK
jgi:hypothetical protein